MKQSKRNLWWSVCAGLLFCSWGCSSRVSDKPVTLETLLDEMVSVEEQALYPVPSYTCRQESSYDRASVSPDSAGWFANSDGFGIKRVDTVAGRIEKVMFDEVGPERSLVSGLLPLTSGVRGGFILMVLINRAGSFRLMT